MIAQTKWTERRFDFSFPPGLFPCILERLRGTPARIEEMVKDVPAELLTKRTDNAWSIQEHIGHLVDLELLHEGRIDDFLSNAEVLRAADMSNKRTYEADHNNKSLRELLGTFRASRMGFVARLEGLSDDVIMRVSHHPRLNQRMRVPDMAYFVSEHDDHHLAIMKRLISG